MVMVVMVATKPPPSSLQAKSNFFKNQFIPKLKNQWGLKS